MEMADWGERLAGAPDYPEHHRRTCYAGRIWTPVIVVQVYLTLVFILFVFGPWPWPVDNGWMVNTYLVSAQALLLMGYALSATRKGMTILVINRARKRPVLDHIKLIKYSLIVAFALLVPTYMGRAGLDSFSVAELFRSFIKGIVSPGQQYYERLQSVSGSTTSRLFLLITAVTAPLRWLFVPLSVVHWSELPTRYKLSLAVYVIVDTIGWISIGTNKGVFDNVFVVMFSALVRASVGQGSTRERPPTRVSKLKIGLVGLLLICLAVIYMVNAVTSRLSGTTHYYNSKAGIAADLDSPILSLVPDWLVRPLVIVASYATQGYYGLSLAMREPFTPTHGFGSSWMSLSIYKNLTGDDSLALSAYPFKVMKYGWDPYANWHSIYTWLASDFSFAGTLAIMVLIGYLFGEVWKSVLVQRSSFATGLFVLLMIMFMYFPANNQVFAYVDTFCAFWGLLIAWLVYDRIRL